MSNNTVIKQVCGTLLLISLMSLLLVSTVQAQAVQPDFSIELNRNFGYGGFGGDIQGAFTIVPSTSQEFSRIEYYLDSQLMAEVGPDTLKYRFDTGEFNLGVHTIHAIGYDANGNQYYSNEIRAEFVSASTGWNMMIKIIAPILVLTFIMILLSSGIANLGNKRKDVRGDYGLLGGSVCPKCGMPFKMHFGNIKLGVGRLVRCPHCKSWSLVRRASASDLAEAEAKFFDSAEPQVDNPERQREEYIRSIEDSRYIDE